MAKTKIDFKAVAMKVGGHAAGAMAFTQINKIEYLKNLPAEKQALKGAIVAAIGYIGVPFVAEHMGLKGKGKGDFVNHIGEGLGMVGTMILGNAVVKPAAGKPALFPTISGYEEGVYGLGLIADEERYDATQVEGLDNNDVYATN